MSMPYTVSASPTTTPISAGGLNDNFQYLDARLSDGVPTPPTDPAAVFVLASRGGFMFWVATEEC